MRIGLVGYSAQKFDQELALDCLQQAFDLVEQLFKEESKEDSPVFTLVSGLTDLGIPALGYREADRRGWQLMGVACRKARKYNCYPVHKSIFVGDNWGDESETFINSIDILIRVGGGKQSLQEVAMAQDLDMVTIEFELEAIQ